MKHSNHIVTAACRLAQAAVLCLSLNPAWAQDICSTSVGANCNTALGDFGISDGSPDLFFLDTDVGQPDWQVRINEGGVGKFTLVESNPGPSFIDPLIIDGGARNNAIRIAAGGLIGLGTATPAHELHIVDAGVGFGPAIDFQDDDGQTWRLEADDSSFAAFDVTGVTRPLQIEPGAPDDSLYVQSTGQIGVGTFTPNLDAGFGIHIAAASNEFAFLGAGVNPAGGGSCAFNIGYGGGAAPGMVFITTRPCGGTEMTRFFVGNTERARADVLGFQVFGSLRVNGTGVNVPDYVFRPGFTIESIEEHAESMWKRSHLPALSPGAADGGFEVAKTTMGMLEELEKAHIYIEQLNEEAKQKDERTAALETDAAELRRDSEELQRNNAELAARVERLEALFAAAIDPER